MTLGGSRSIQLSYEDASAARQERPASRSIYNTALRAQNQVEPAGKMVYARREQTTAASAPPGGQNG